MVDLEGLRGQPGEASHPSPVVPFYYLAVGETWSVSKDGTVSISR